MFRQLFAPIVVNVLFFAVALSPVDLLGCRTRGLLAVLLALGSGIGAIAAAGSALKTRLRNEAGTERRIVTTLLLAVPVAALIVLA